MSINTNQSFQNCRDSFLSFFSLFKVNSEVFISELQRKYIYRCSPGVNRSPDASLCPVWGHMAGVCMSLHKSDGVSLVQAQAREKAWGLHFLPCCASADTICMPGAAQQFLLFLWAWPVGSECRTGITLRKGNRWERKFCFPAKYPPKLMWFILCVGMSRILTCEVMRNAKIFAALQVYQLGCSTCHFECSQPMSILGTLT